MGPNPDQPTPSLSEAHDPISTGLDASVVHTAIETRPATPQPTEQVTPEVARVQRAEAALRAYLDAEPLGSAKSMAFLDGLDLSLVEWDQSERGKTSAALIRETVRQRINGVPGYMHAYHTVNTPQLELEQALINKHVKQFDGDKDAEMRDWRNAGREDLTERLVKIRNDYLTAKSEQATASSAMPQGATTTPQA